MDLGSLSNHSGHAARKSNQAIGLIYKKDNNFICPSHFGYFFGSLHPYNMKGPYATMEDNIKKVFSFSELECSLTRIQLQENFGPTFDNCLCSFSSFVKHFFYRKPNSCKK